MKITILLILLLFLALTILPIIGQIYFANRRLKEQLNFPLYGIHMAAMLAELILASVCTLVAINILPDYTDRQVGEKLCVVGATSFFGVGLLGVLIIQPLIAFYFYSKASVFK